MEKIGEGGEAEVFALDHDRVLRRFRRGHPSIAHRVALTAEIAAGATHLDVAVPEILDHFLDDVGRPCFVERRLPGRSLTEALGEVAGARRAALLESYLATAQSLRSIDVQRPWVGELITDPPLRSASWAGYLRAALERQGDATDPTAYPDVDLTAARAAVSGEIDELPEPSPSIVHFDYFPGNVLCDDSRITAVIDWSVLSIFGDPELDVTMAVAYLGVTPTATADDRDFGRRWLAAHELADRALLYDRWAALWWAPVTDDPRIPGWVRARLAQDDRGPEP